MGAAVLSRLGQWGRWAPALALLLLAPGALRGQTPPVEDIAPASAPAAAPVEDKGEETPGPLVTAIEVRSDAPLDPALNLDDLIEVDAGKPLTDLAVRHTLRNLQATGNAANLEIYTPRRPGRRRRRGGGRLPCRGAA